MRHTIVLLLGLLLFLNVSCKPAYTSRTIENTFTTEQIKDLNKIRAFFKEQICLYTDSSFKTCYEEIPHEYLQATGNQFWANINFEKQKELYSEISKKTFDEIWTFCETTYYPSEIKAKTICPTPIGKYYTYLSKIGETNKKIAQYTERLSASGDFSFLDIQPEQVLKDKKSFNLNDPNIQLILAIHYLSLNDQNARKPN